MTGRPDDSTSGGHDGMELAPIDLDTAPLDDEEPAARHESGRGHRWRWAAIPLLLALGAAIGVYVADARADSAASHAVSIQFGGIEVDAGGVQAQQPVRFAVHLLNSGSHEVMLVGLEVAGFDGRDLGPVDREGDGIALPSGEWVSVSLSRTAACPDPGGLSTAYHSAPSEVTVDVERLGRQTQVTLPGPAVVGQQVGQVLANACEAPREAEAGHEYIGLESLTIGEPTESGLAMSWRVHADSTYAGEITAISSTSPGLTVTVAGLPVDIHDADSLDAVWTVDCATLRASQQVLVDIEVTTEDDVHTMSSWLQPDITFGLGVLAAQACPGHNWGS